MIAMRCAAKASWRFPVAGAWVFLAVAGPHWEARYRCGARRRLGRGPVDVPDDRRGGAYTDTGTGGQCRRDVRGEYADLAFELVDKHRHRTDRGGELGGEVGDVSATLGDRGNI